MVDNMEKRMTAESEEEKTLSDRASTRLTHAIITGELAQGQKLSEAELATRFGISRGPLREAIRRLEGMRLVKRIPHAGARVVTLNKTMMAELYRVREALEGMACRLAAEQMSSTEVASLFELLAEHESQIEAAEGREYLQSEGDFDFHYHIALGSRNQMLIDLLAGDMYQLLRMCRYKTGTMHKRPQLALNQHRQITEAIANRDGDLAELLMRRHISGAWKTISQDMDDYS
ncbi:MAG: GntR family transcriptional regulator [Thiothrix sp.]|nr:GntR family transcriptional regulator [Thiothrix sp.]